MTRSAKIVWIVVGSLVAMLALSASLASFYTEVLWFDDLGQVDVFWTALGWKWAVGASFTAVAFALIYVNMRVARSLAPRARLGLAGSVPAQVAEAVQRVRETVEPRLRWLLPVVAAIAALAVGSGMGGSWERFALAFNSVSFGVKDPQFGLDVGFFVFTLPALRATVDWLAGALFVALLLAAAVHLIDGGIRPWERLAGFAPHVKAHLSVLLGLAALLKAADYLLRIYELDFSPRGQVTGASYTDVHAQLPAYVILIGIALVTAVLLMVNIRFKGWRLPLAALALWVVASILVAGVYPFAVQQLRVEPNEVVVEAPFIKRNIEATRRAFGLEDVEARQFPASEDLTAADIKRNQGTIEDVRLWDPTIVAQSYRQLQSLRPYYEFTDVDVDRYEIDGRRRQVLISAREMDVSQLPDQARNWVNEHTFFTHGYAVVMSPVSEATSRGLPRFIIGDIPPDAPADLQVKRNEIYFGEREDNYVIVHASRPEFDYPVGEENATTTYEADTGVPTGSLLNRVAFALRFGSKDLLFSPLITSKSKVLFRRSIPQRVGSLAPWLGLEDDPYPVLADGRIKWVVDGYTSSDRYPYSEPFYGVSYIRNSVKTVIDAYDGTVTLYAFDPDDPILAAWGKVFPGLITPGDKMPNAIREHLRYPEGLFRLQAQVYRTYHMKDPQVFYNKEDAWDLPMDSGQEMTPFYVLMSLPGETEEDFLIMLPFTPRNRANMIGWMAAKSDPGDYGQRVVFQFPKKKVVLGPEQVSARINQDEIISPQLSLWNQRGSNALFGNMLVIPIEDSIVYIQPLYLQAEQAAIPELTRVVVVYADKVVMESDLEAALLAVFGEGEPDEPSAPGSREATPTPGSATATAAEAADLYRRAIEAQQKGDWAEYGSLIKRLGTVLERLAAGSAEATRSR